MRTKVVKWGNSLGLRIPKTFAEEVHVAEGSLVELTVVDGRLVIQTTNQNNYTLESMLANINDENLHSEIDAGEPVGLEQW